jgi:anti-sigma B factor antagonist
MEISSQRFKRADLISITGRVDATTAPRLEAALRACIAEERFKFVVDLSGSDYISSAGLKVLLGIQKEVKRWNRGELRISGLQPRVRETLEMVGLLPVFRTFDTPLDAVGSF